MCARSDRALITMSHGTITVHADYGRGVLLVFSERRPRRRDRREARRIVRRLTDGTVRRFGAEGSADVFEFFISPAALHRSDDCNVLSSEA